MEVRISLTNEENEQLERAARLRGAHGPHSKRAFVKKAALDECERLASALPKSLAKRKPVYAKKDEVPAS